MNEPQIIETRRLIALARQRFDEARADRPGTAGHAERVAAAQKPLDAFERRLAELEAHRARVEAHSAQQAAVVAVPAPVAPAVPAVDPDTLDRARRAVEAAEAEVTRTRSDRPAWPDWLDRMDDAHGRLRDARARLAAFERQDAAHQAGAARAEEHANA